MRPLATTILAVTCFGGFLVAPAYSQGPCQYYVAPPPVGNDSNPGTSAQPWATLNWASDRVFALGESGCTVLFADGVYTGGNSLYEQFTVPTTFKAANPYRAVIQNNGVAVSLFGARNMVFEGFEFRHTGPGATPLIVQMQRNDADWTENIVLRNNIFHDSWDNDLLKINNGARFVTVENNVFYNQTGHDEHIDVNSVTDVVIQDNIFFNDFAGSGRANNNDTSAYIVIKDSNGDEDGLEGSQRITVRRNIFLNWQGSSGSNFLLIGEDGQPYYEGRDILVENNLMVGNSPNTMRASLGVKGGANVVVRNNTIAGDLPAAAFAFRVNQEGNNPVNANILFYNNIWSDPTGTMGAGSGGGNDFSDGLPSEVVNLVLDRNLYWNGGAPIPAGDQIDPLVNDARRIVANPLLNTNQAGIVLPRWNGATFLSGNTRVRDEFIRLVNLYGSVPFGSPGQNQADPALSPADDILGRTRTQPDMGAFEATIPSLSITDLSVVEGNTGTTNAVFTVRLSSLSTLPVSVSWSTAPGTATPGADYTTSSGLVSIPPGATSQTLSVPVLGDTLPETDETFTVNLSGAVNAVIGDGQALGTILDDEALSYLTVTPCRLADTRLPPGPSGAPAMAAASIRAFPATGLCGIPATAKALAVNVTVVGATAAGNLRLYPRKPWFLSRARSRTRRSRPGGTTPSSGWGPEDGSACSATCPPGWPT